MSEKITKYKHQKKGNKSEYLTTGLFVSRVNLNNIDLVNYVKTILFNKT